MISRLPRGERSTVPSFSSRSLSTVVAFGKIFLYVFEKHIPILSLSENEEGKVLLRSRNIPPHSRILGEKTKTFPPFFFIIERASARTLYTHRKESSPPSPHFAGDKM